MLYSVRLKNRNLKFKFQAATLMQQEIHDLDNNIELRRDYKSLVIHRPKFVS